MKEDPSAGQKFFDSSHELAFRELIILISLIVILNQAGIDDFNQWFLNHIADDNIILWIECAGGTKGISFGLIFLG